MTTFLKDPEAELDYSVDWAKWLAAGETISSSSWDAPAGLNKVRTSFDNTGATVFLGGGVPGETYRVTNSIVTSVDRKDSRSLTIKCVER